MVHHAIQSGDLAGEHFQGASRSLLAVWKALRAEVFSLLCTSSAKYRSERKVLESTGRPAITALSTYLTASFGVEVATASALASLALLLALKMTVNAWCAAATSKALEEREMEMLEQIRSKPHSKRSSERSRPKHDS